MFAWSQDLPINEEIYGRIRDRLAEARLEGLVVHLAIRADDGHIRYVDVWESEAKCDAAFETDVHPAVYGVLKEMGFQPAGEPSRTLLNVIDVRLGGGVPAQLPG